MSNAETNTQDESKKAGKGLIISMVVGGLFCLLLLYFTFSSNPVKVSKDGDSNQKAPEDTSLRSAQEMLSSDNDLASCKSFLQQINNHLATHPQEKPATIPNDLRDILKKYNLAEQQFNEIDSPTFTKLDAHYLEEKLMLRDIARFLEPPVLGGKQTRAPVSEVATQAFQWVVRQIRLSNRNTNPVPPIYAMRRGWATSYERSLVFLSLLDQFLFVGEKLEQPVGCLVLLPGKEANTQKLWLGVVNEAKNDFYLFDPQLGLPLPGGKEGKPLQLTELKADPSKLRLLDGENAPYEVLPEHLAKIELAITSQVSSLAPRMKLMEEKYLPTGTKARLHSNLVSLVENLEKAGRPALGANMKILMVPQVLETYRIFLPAEEGGFANPQVFNIFRSELVPQTAIPRQLAQASHPLILENIGQMLSSPFISSVLDTKLPRDQMLHARYSKAVPDLVREGDELRGQLRAAENDSQLDSRIATWMNKAREVCMNMETVMQKMDKTPEDVAQVNQELLKLFKSGERDLKMLVAGSIGKPRGEQIAWLLALCKHELAEQQQRRFNATVKATGQASAQAEQDRLNKWKDAESSWRRFLEDFPTGPGVPHGQMLRGYALEKAGNYEEARRVWREFNRPMAAQEKCARLFLAKNLPEKKP